MSTHQFAKLTPDFILSAIENLGFWCDARIYPLNSYENRVYQVGIEDKPTLIAKFYRPHRWTKTQILEEHTMLLNLKKANLSVIAPIAIEGNTLFSYDGFDFCLYDKQLGQAPEADNMDHLFSTGELLGQMHNLMQKTRYQTRPTMHPIDDFEHAFESVLASVHMPKSVKSIFPTLHQKLHSLITNNINHYWPTTLYPIHADCHRSNLLINQEQLYILDFDDSKTGPAVQDLWLHLSGAIEQQRQQLSELIEGYESYNPFDSQELKLIDSLKACRLIQYAAWLDNRWSDPAFPLAFPWFKAEDYWLNLANDLQTIIKDWGKLA